MIAKWDDRSYDADAFVNFNLDENGKAEGMKLKPISDITDFSFPDFAFVKKVIMRVVVNQHYAFKFLFHGIDMGIVK